MWIIIPVNKITWLLITDKMNIYSLNVNGLNDERVEELDQFLKSENPALVFLQETKRREDQLQSRLFFNNYKYIPPRDLVLQSKVVVLFVAEIGCRSYPL